MIAFFIAIFKMGLFVKFLIVFMLGLMIWSWAVFIEKTAVLKIKKILFKSFEKEYYSGEMLDKLYNNLKDKPVIHSPSARIFYVGMKELKKSNITNIKFTMDYADGIKRNIRDRILSLTSAEKLAILEESKVGINSIASISAVSPFIGIGASMWNLISAFQEIAQSKPYVTITELLPAIAESFYPIVVAMAVSVPCIFFYNKLTWAINRFGAECDIFALEIGNSLGRELDIIAIQQNNAAAQQQASGGDNLPQTR